MTIRITRELLIGATVLFSLAGIGVLLRETPEILRYLKAEAM